MSLPPICETKKELVLWATSYDNVTDLLRLFEAFFFTLSYLILSGVPSKLVNNIQSTEKRNCICFTQPAQRKGGKKWKK